MYDRYRFIRDCNTKGCENVNTDMWCHVLTLCQLYKDTTIHKFIKYANKKYKKNTDYDVTAIKKMVRMLWLGQRDEKIIADTMFGEGTYDAYMKRTERFRKADNRKEQLTKICHRIGIRSPYHKWGEGMYMETNLSAKEIRNLSAKERLDLHFKALEYQHLRSTEEERYEKSKKNKINAYKWIVGFEPYMDWGGRFKECHKVRNMFTGEIVEIPDDNSYGFYWCEKELDFKYRSFKDAADKQQWIRDFYAEAQQIIDNLLAISTIKWAKATKKEKVRSWDSDRYVFDEKLTGIGIDEKTLAIVKDFIERQDAYDAQVELEERARAIRRQQEERERIEEEALQNKIDKAKIDECINRGLDGIRDLWRLHYTSYKRAEALANSKDFCNCGNVLMRFNMNKTIVETSLNINIDVETCKKFFRLITLWRENPSTFKPVEINTHYTGSYTITKFENDVLTAGCHRISYAEMQHMYNEIIANENAA